MAARRSAGTRIGNGGNRARETSSPVAPPKAKPPPAQARRAPPFAPAGCPRAHSAPATSPATPTPTSENPTTLATCRDVSPGGEEEDLEGEDSSLNVDEGSAPG